MSLDSAKVSRHRAGWKKFIGGKRFYSSSGMDRETFCRVVEALEERWKSIQARDGRWTDGEIEAACQIAGVPRPGQKSMSFGNVAPLPAKPPSMLLSREAAES